MKQTDYFEGFNPPALNEAMLRREMDLTGASREEAMALLGRLWDEKEETQDETT